MLRINITPHWELGVASDALLDTTSLLALLAAVQETGAIAQGARTMGMSYRHAWGQIKKATASRSPH